MKLIIRTAALVAGFAPVATMALSTLFVPPAMFIKGTETVYRITVTTREKRSGLIETTCYSSIPQTTDKLYAQNPKLTVTPTGSSFTVELRGRNPGTCTMTFGDGQAEGTTTITVT